MGFSTIAAKQLDWYAEREDCLLIDLRSEEEYRKSHIRGAYSLPFERIQKKMKLLPRDKILVCYCERGGSSLAAAREFSRAGYEAVSVAGGLGAYRGKYLDRCPDSGREKNGNISGRRQKR